MISDCYPPRVGGIESHVRDLGMRLVAAGHEVEVLTATNSADGLRGGAVEVLDGVTVHRLGALVPFGLPINPTGRELLRSRLAEGGFDVAHAHVGVVSPFAVDGADLALEVGIPLTTTWHCVLGRWEPVLRRLGYAQRWADAGVALHGVSEMAADQVRRLAPGADVAVLHNGIDAATWRGGRAEAAPTAEAAESLRVVLAMRFTPRKRPLAVIDIVRRARARSDVPITVEICGGGPLLPLVRAVVARRGWSDWVSLPGRVPRERLVEHYRAADVYLASSRFESFGIAALEGRTVGLPVVALAGSGAEDFISDGVTGLVRSGDSGLVDGLVELAGDRGLVRRLRAHNESVPPQQDWANVVRAVEAEYGRARHHGAFLAAVNHWQVEVEAVDAAGTAVERLRLTHGLDPVADLARRGWAVRRGVAVRQEGVSLTVVLAVEREPDASAQVEAGAEAAPRSPVLTDTGLTAAEIDAAVAYQRVAVYALVETRHGLLLTELSERTSRPGQWTLPGGGIDPGESVVEALHREVWEETGQVIDDLRFLGMRTGHWVGRAPDGRIEDFHAVRLYYLASCPAPAEVVLHDYDGSTASAAWVQRRDLDGITLSATLVDVLAEWLD